MRAFKARCDSRRTAGPVVSLLLALVDLAVGTVDIAAQLAALFFSESAVTALLAFRRPFGAAKIFWRLALYSVGTLAVRLDLEAPTSEIAPRGGTRLRYRSHCRQNYSQQNLHQPHALHQKRS